MIVFLSLVSKLYMSTLLGEQEAFLRDKTRREGIHDPWRYPNILYPAPPPSPPKPVRARQSQLEVHTVRLEKRRGRVAVVDVANVKVVAHEATGAKEAP